jgi:hypothetical protein
MKCTKWKVFALAFVAALFAAGCGNNKGEESEGVPANVSVEQEQDSNVVTVAHPEQFPVVAAVEHAAPWSLEATGSVLPDISRTCRSSRWPAAAW